MQDQNYSQAPILNSEDEVIGLLTTDTIARWVGAHIDQDQEGTEFLLTENTTVAHIQDHAEREDNYTFLARNATLFDAAETFRVEANDYGPIDAVLITENGESSESLLGIITVADLPAIQRKL
jgi:CBS domain-containing protein